MLKEQGNKGVSVKVLLEGSKVNSRENKVVITFIDLAVEVTVL